MGLCGRCFKRDDRERLLAVIESAFGRIAPFNKILREILEEKVERISARHSRSRTSRRPVVV